VGLLDAIAGILTFAGQVLTLLSKNQLTQETLDKAVAALHKVD
jgi:hypothetical protein